MAGIEQHVTSLEISKRLKDLGVKQHECFYRWMNLGDVWGIFLNSDRRFAKYSKEEFDIACEGSFPAFLASELGELLPKDVYIPYKGNSGKKRKYPQHLHCFFSNTRYIVNYTGGNSQEHLTQVADTEANARAKMLIYLLENGIITLKWPVSEK